MAHTRVITSFQSSCGIGLKFSGMMEFWNLCWKSCSLTKNEWKNNPSQCWYQSKLANSRAFLESLNPGFLCANVIKYSQQWAKSIKNMLHTAVWFQLFISLNFPPHSQPINIVLFLNWPIASLGENK